MFSIEGLTHRQTEILEFLRKFRREGKSAPTYREIAKHFGFKSTKAVADHITALEKKGYVRRHVGRSRGIEIVSSDNTSINNTITVPILGNIPAGYPAEQTEHRLGTLAVDKAMLDGSTRHRLFALLVSGESMEGRGIHDGDWVIADADLSPQEGDVVVALIDGENTLKTLAKQRDRFFLKAESLKHPDLIPIKEIMIQGVVRSIFRRMN